MAAPRIPMRSIVRFEGKIMRVEAISGRNEGYLLRDLASGVLRSSYEAGQNIRVVKVRPYQYKVVNYIEAGSSLSLEMADQCMDKGIPFFVTFPLTDSNPLHTEILGSIRRHCDITVEFVFVSKAEFYITGSISVESEDPKIKKQLKDKEKRAQRKLKGAEGAQSSSS